MMIERTSFLFIEKAKLRELVEGVNVCGDFYSSSRQQ